MYSPDKKQVIERWNAMPDILRDAINSSIFMDDLDAIEQNYHLSDSKVIQLSRLIRGVFYGLIHTEDLYKEIRDALGIDPRLALEIYHEIDNKVFQSVKKEIEDNYIRFRLGATKESEINQPKSTTSQVVLREGPEIVNLKPETPVEVQSTKLKIEGVSAVEKPKGPAPVSMGAIQKKVEVSNSTVTPPVQNTGQEKNAVPQGPFILHKMEDVQSIAGAQATAPYKQTSFGGYFGSMKTAGMQKPKESISSARVEMPFYQKPKEADIQKVPVVVKKYEEEPSKTVHISDYKTPLEKTPDGKVVPMIAPQPLTQKKAEEEGVVDLLNLTIKKQPDNV